MCLLTVVLQVCSRTVCRRLERAQCPPCWQLVRNAVPQDVHQLQRLHQRVQLAHALFGATPTFSPLTTNALISTHKESIGS